MKRLAQILMLAAMAASLALAEGHEAKGEADLDLWKWANFLVLAGGLGYLAVKNGGPYFASRSENIRKDIAESEAIAKDAQARAAAVDARLANLEVEIVKLRTESTEEMRAESARMANQTAVALAKIQQQAEQEIEASAKAAQAELRQYSARLALELAERKIQAGLDSSAEDTLVANFCHGLERTVRPASKN